MGGASAVVVVAAKLHFVCVSFARYLFFLFSSYILSYSTDISHSLTEGYHISCLNSRLHASTIPN